MTKISRELTIILVWPEIDAVFAGIAASEGQCAKVSELVKKKKKKERER